MHFREVKSILSPRNGMNLYRGCQHGCIYCDSRSKCYHIEHDFEDIEVKSNALVLLEDALRRKRQPCMIGTGSMSDPYMPLEAELQYTRKSLELIHRYGCGATVLTKSDLVLRDLDLLQRINSSAKAVLQMTLTTFDEQLCRVLEPNVCTTRRRCEVLREFSAHGIPTVVWLSPILPFLNDTEQNLRGILQACFEAGVKGILCFGMGVTLREGDREYFYAALDRHFPGLSQRYRDTYGNAYEVVSHRNGELMRIFHSECEKHRVMHRPDEIFAYLSAFEQKNIPEQLSLFGE
ncbi:MAG: radical SAM protein [Clostridia bacterium]|nr:radical SAM protein [Clostridia bacterium]